MPLVSNSASAILELLRYVGCDVTTYLPWTVWVNNCHSTKTILPCISAWNDRWRGKFCDRKLLGILWLFNILSAFSFTLWGKVAFFKISLLVAAFTTFDFSLALEKCCGKWWRFRLSVFLQPGTSHDAGNLGTWAEEWWGAERWTICLAVIWGWMRFPVWIPASRSQRRCWGIIGGDRWLQTFAYTLSQFG